MILALLKPFFIKTWAGYILGIIKTIQWDTGKVEVKPFKTDKPLTAQSEKYRLFPLIPFEPEQLFETYFIEIDPGTIFSGEPHKGNTYEYVFVISGRLEISVDGEKFKSSQTV